MVSRQFANVACCAALTVLMLQMLGACSPVEDSSVDSTEALRRRRHDAGAAGAADAGTPTSPVGTGAAPPPSASTPSASSPLFAQTDLVYAGAFRLPGGKFGASSQNDSFAEGGTALAYNPANDSLFMVGHAWEQLVSEVKIPAVSKSDTVAGLATAAVLQPFADASEGKMSAIGSGVHVGGLLVHDQKLYMTAYIYYDASGSQSRSHFVRPLDLSAGGQVQGPFAVSDQNPGVVSGYMTDVPAAWQSAFGGPLLTGQCCIPIVSRTSFGAGAFAFDPADLGVKTPAPATQLVGYPQAHPLAAWDSTGPLFNGSTQMGGVIFPENRRSVLFWGRQGVGPYCYGTGADCNDPTDGSKGTHAYPYVYQIWAYDALDLAAAKSGAKAPWDVKPYALWNFDLPYQDEGRRIGGVAYDARTGRVFVSQMYGDGPLPVIHVFTVRP